MGSTPERSHNGEPLCWECGGLMEILCEEPTTFDNLDGCCTGGTLWECTVCEEQAFLLLDGMWDDP